MGQAVGRGRHVARKVFQHFAHVLCQRFIEVPSNHDLVNLALFGGGTVVMDIWASKDTCNRYPIDPLPYAADAKTWICDQLKERNIPPEQLVGARLTVDYTVSISRKVPDIPFPVGAFDFCCTGSITSPDREYTATLNATKTWGLMQV